METLKKIFIDRGLGKILLIFIFSTLFLFLIVEIKFIDNYETVENYKNNKTIVCKQRIGSNRNLTYETFFIIKTEVNNKKYDFIDNSYFVKKDRTSFINLIYCK